MSGKLSVSEHPLVLERLAGIRDKRTDPATFRRLLTEIGAFLAYDLLREVRTRKGKVNTPLKAAEARFIDQPVACVAILRAGLSLSDGVARVCPDARFGHIGIYRNEASLEPVRYYVRLPKDLEKSFVILTDPMIATGGSAIEAISILKSAGAKAVHLLALIAAKSGVEKVHAAHPDVSISLAAVDPVLNDNGYIVPGLGDAGDRTFGT